MSKKVTDFFPKVSEALYSARVAVADVADKEARMIAAEKKQAETRMKQLEIFEKSEAAKKKYEESRRKKNKKAHEQRDVDDDSPAAALDVIDNVVDRMIFGDQVPGVDKDPKKRTERPLNWHVIAEYAHSHGYERAIKTFAEDLAEYSATGAYQAVRRWVKDFKAGRNPNTYASQHIREPAIGKAMDVLLLKDVLERRKLGLSVDDCVLELLLRDRLKEANKLSLLRENGNI